MPTIPHLVCRLREALYAVDACIVREIFGLPDLTPIAELPSYIAGVVNLRGTIVPVLDLDRRFGHAPAGYSLTDVVIVLAWDQHILGLIVNDVQDVQEIAAAAMDTLPSFNGGGRPQARFVSGLAKIGETILMVLDHERLYSDAEPVIAALNARANTPSPAPEDGPGRVFWSQASREERAVLTERARHLVRPIESKDMQGQVPLAAVVLGGERFGVDLPLIQEFSPLSGVTPVPCCPQHIAGQINLRGDIVTLVDIAPSLNLPPTAPGGNGKVMVVQLDHLRLGILVDDVSDVIYLCQDEIAEVPAAVKAAGREFLKGTAPYAGKMLGLLDLRGLLTTGDLTVNEEV